MSEQSKSNYQALGAGLLGFIAVMAVGGGGLMLHSSHRANSAAKPAPAAAPIDLGAAMPAPSMGRPSVQKERRAESPAPLIGEIEEEPAGGVSASASADAAAASPESAPGARTPALEVTRHLELEKGSSSAEAVVKNTVPAKEAADLPGRKAPAPKLEVAAGEGAVASSVHYGVTSRNELMGRAAGPVYNFKGNKGGAAVNAAGKMADDADGKMADLRRQLEASGLPEDQRAKLLKELDEAMKNASATAKTAQ
ncbi:MAG: hypothetical protein Q8T11_05235 [Elusimicrobiota bacterium]|nr:hypothetical protein [Elusimicrobiota bacterium]